MHIYIIKYIIYIYYIISIRPFLYPYICTGNFKELFLFIFWFLKRPSIGLKIRKVLKSTIQYEILKQIL